MPPHASVEIRQPRTDDRAICDMVEGIVGYHAVLVAHDLKLFALLAERPRTLPQVCDALWIARRPAEALLAVCASLGLIEVRDGDYSLSPTSEDYLVESSPTYMGESLDMMIRHRAIYSFDGLKQAMLTNAPRIYDGQGWIKTHQEHADLAREFTHLMHAHSLAPALAWPERIDLAGSRLMLDIGGGSGAHAIGAARRWPHLEAIVLELASVCEVADEYIARYGLSHRIRTQIGDMWNDPFPPADLHFYSDVYHDWAPERCRALTRKSFEGLEPGGRIIIHEMLYNDEKTGPFAVAGLSAEMLLWTEGQQFSGAELSAMVADAGFVEVQLRPTFGYWSIVTGRKP